MRRVDPVEVRGDPLISLQVGVAEGLREAAPEFGGGPQSPGRGAHAAAHGRRQPGPVGLQLQGRVPAVAGEDVVAPCAREQHLDAVLPGQTADEEGVDRRRVGLGLVEVEDHVAQLVDHLGAHVDDLQIDVEVLHDAARVGEVAGHALGDGPRILEADREALEPIVAHGALRKGHHAARVEAAREEGAHRHVRDELPLHRLCQVLAHLYDGVLHRPLDELLVEGQFVEAPPALDAAVADAQRVARLELPNRLQHGQRRGAPQVEQVVVDRGVVQSAIDRGLLEQGLELAGEEHALRGLGEVERLHAHAVAHHHQRAVPRVVEGEGEDAVEPLHHLLAIAQVEVEEHLGVAVAAEAIAVGDELLAKHAVVVDFAVVDDGHGAGDVRHRLVAAGGQVDDRETPVGESHAVLRIGGEPRVVRSAVGDGRVHALEERCVEVSRVAD